ncbi:hypothetical protein P7C73_g243, partial [Tremellales sp. Uapishka_1]
MPSSSLWAVMTTSAALATAALASSGRDHASSGDVATNNLTPPATMEYLTDSCSIRVPTESSTPRKFAARDMSSEGWADDSSSCADPAGYASCIKDLDQDLVTCVQKDQVNPDAGIDCAIGVQVTAQICTWKFCWNEISGVQYQNRSGAFERATNSSPPGYPAPMNEPGSPVCDFSAGIAMLDTVTSYLHNNPCADVDASQRSLCYCCTDSTILEAAMSVCPAYYPGDLWYFNEAWGLVEPDADLCQNMDLSPCGALVGSYFTPNSFASYPPITYPAGNLPAVSTTGTATANYGGQTSAMVFWSSFTTTITFSPTQTPISGGGSTSTSSGPSVSTSTPVGSIQGPSPASSGGLPVGTSTITSEVIPSSVYGGPSSPGISLRVSSMTSDITSPVTSDAGNGPLRLKTSGTASHPIGRNATIGVIVGVVGLIYRLVVTVLSPIPRIRPTLALAIKSDIGMLFIILVCAIGLLQVPSILAWSGKVSRDTTISDRWVDVPAQCADPANYQTCVAPLDQNLVDCAAKDQVNPDAVVDCAIGVATTAQICIWKYCWNQVNGVQYQNLSAILDYAVNFSPPGYPAILGTPGSPTCDFSAGVAAYKTVLGYLNNNPCNTLNNPTQDQRTLCYCCTDSTMITTAIELCPAYYPGDLWYFNSIWNLIKSDIAVCEGADLSQCGQLYGSSFAPNSFSSYATLDYPASTLPDVSTTGTATANLAGQTSVMTFFGPVVTIITFASAQSPIVSSPSSSGGASISSSASLRGSSASAVAASSASVAASSGSASVSASASPSNSAGAPTVATGHVSLSLALGVTAAAAAYIVLGKLV